MSHAGAGAGLMALDELKVRARVRLNGARRAGAGEERKLRHCLDEVAREAGFAHWEHARHVLSGQAMAGEDMGAFWHAPGCDALLNEWFADLAAARAALRQGRYLLPFRRQYVVVEAPYIRELGLDPDHAAWAAAGADLVSAYGTAAWATLASARMRAAGPAARRG
jgi:hypothetical protein